MGILPVHGLLGYSRSARLRLGLARSLDAELVLHLYLQPATSARLLHAPGNRSAPDSAPPFSRYSPPLQRREGIQAPSVSEKQPPLPDLAATAIPRIEKRRMTHSCPITMLASSRSNCLRSVAAASQRHCPLLPASPSSSRHLHHLGQSISRLLLRQQTRLSLGRPSLFQLSLLLHRYLNHFPLSHCLFSHRNHCLSLPLRLLRSPRLCRSLSLSPRRLPFDHAAKIALRQLCTVYRPRGKEGIKNTFLCRLGGSVKGRNWPRRKSGGSTKSFAADRCRRARPSALTAKPLSHGRP